jgi:hypothetical protein
MTCLDAPLGGLMETTSGHFGEEFEKEKQMME